MFYSVCIRRSEIDLSQSCCHVEPEPEGSEAEPEAEE